MKEFNNGDEVLVEFEGEIWTSYYVGKHPGRVSNFEVVIIRGELKIVESSKVKPKPATIIVNGIEVPKFKQNYFVDCGSQAPTTMELSFHNGRDAQIFYDALMGENMEGVK